MEIGVVEVAIYLVLGFALAFLVVWAPDHLLARYDGAPPTERWLVFSVILMTGPVLAVLLFWSVDLIQNKPL